MLPLAFLFCLCVVKMVLNDTSHHQYHLENGAISLQLLTFPASFKDRGRSTFQITKSHIWFWKRRHQGYHARSHGDSQEFGIQQQLQVYLVMSHEVTSMSWESRPQFLWTANTGWLEANPATSLESISQIQKLPMSPNAKNSIQSSLRLKMLIIRWWCLLFLSSCVPFCFKY